MHLFPSLGELIEAPGAEQARIAKMLGLAGEVNRQDFTNLFVIQLFPYASIYLSENGLAGGAVRDRVTEYWQVLGRTPPQEPDHAATLLKSYSTLHSQYRGEYIASEVAEQCRPVFFWDAIASWMPAYLLRVRELASPLYKTWSEITSDVIEAEAAQLPAPNAPPFYLRSAPMPPSINDPSAFIDALFAPLVSGVILCRYDLGRCAAANNLTPRMADRRHTLKLLLAQDTDGVCSWLHDEITRQAELLGGLPGVLGPVRDHWADRARAFTIGIQDFRERYAKGLPVDLP